MMQRILFNAVVVILSTILVVGEAMDRTRTVAVEGFIVMPGMASSYCICA